MFEGGLHRRVAPRQDFQRAFAIRIFGSGIALPSRFTVFFRVVKGNSQDLIHYQVVKTSGRGKVLVFESDPYPRERRRPGGASRRMSCVSQRGYIILVYSLFCFTYGCGGAYQMWRVCVCFYHSFVFGGLFVRLFRGVVSKSLNVPRERVTDALRLLNRNTAVPFVDHCHGRTANKLSRIRVRRVGRQRSGLYSVTGHGRAVLNAVARRNGLATRLRGHVGSA